MSTQTQYNPNAELNRILFEAGASKTVYALVTPETEAAKAKTVGRDPHDHSDIPFMEYCDMFREAWTAKQDAYHEDFFNEWCKWSAPVVDLDREQYPFYYPCNGASEPIRHIIFDRSRNRKATIHVFAGEYEGYKSQAEAAMMHYREHRREDWRSIPDKVYPGDLFFVSQPSAIDGNVWREFNEFVAAMPFRSVVVDCTYVGAVPEESIRARFNLNAPSIRNVIFSLSKPFGVYYDRVGGVFCRDEDLGLFGNKWFKNLTSLRLGTILLKQNDVFALPEMYADVQARAVEHVSEKLGYDFKPSDVFILATATPDDDSDMGAYLLRAGKLRLCLTKYMAEKIGTARPTRVEVAA